MIHILSVSLNSITTNPCGRLPGWKEWLGCIQLCTGAVCKCIGIRTGGCLGGNDGTVFDEIDGYAFNFSTAAVQVEKIEDGHVFDFVLVLFADASASETFPRETPTH